MSLNICRQIGFELFEFFFDLFTNRNRIGSRLAGDGQAGSLRAVGAFFETQVLYGIVHLGNVADKHRRIVKYTHHQVADFFAEFKFSFDSELIGFTSHFDVTCRQVHIIDCNGIGHLFQAQSGRIHFFGIHIHVHIALGGAGNVDRTDSIDALEWIHHLFFQDFIESVVAFVGSDGVHQNRHHVGTQLEDRWTTGAVGQKVVVHIDGTAHIVYSFVQIGPPFKFHTDHRYVVGRGGVDFLDALHAVESVFEQFGYIGFYLGGIGP